MIFVVQSGFLVGGQVLARLREARFRIDNYAVERATRIFIPLISACFFIAAVGAPSEWRQADE